MVVVDRNAELPKMPQVIVPQSWDDTELTNLGYAYLRAQLEMRRAGFVKEVKGAK